MEWKEVLLGELVDIYDSKRIPLTSQEREKIKGDIPYYGAQGIIDYINQFLFDGEYILIAEDGNNIISRQENIAQIAKGKFWVNNHAHILQGKIEQNLLCYIINHTDISGYVTGSAQPKLNQANLLKIPIKIPVNLSDQRKIAGILSALDSKIENNNKINANLEAQAEALFKSWFVDFTPFKDQPFVDSELGPIPQGWKVGKLGDIGEIVGGSTPSKSKPEYYTTHGIAWLTPKDLSTSKAKFTSRGEIDITDEGYNSTSTKLMPRGSVLFSSRAPIGYLTIAKNEICTNQGFKSLVPNGAGTGFIYYTLRHLTPQIENRATGSTFKEASATLMRSVETIVPPTSILNKFEELLRPILQFQEKKEEENQRLAALRDTLLPKLMSGEIKL